jgi:hypothetical protein
MAYCILYFDNILWKVMQHELDKNSIFDLEQNSYYTRYPCRIQDSLRKVMKQFPGFKALELNVLRKRITQIITSRGFILHI